MKSDSYWEKLSKEKPLPSMKKPCKDCAIACGFYTSCADELLKQPKDIQEKVMKTWFCHNHPDRCCKGLESTLRGRRDEGK